MESDVTAVLPPSFDHHIYRLANPDLTDYSNSELEDHYNSFGKAEGRICSEIHSKSAFSQFLMPYENSLEIGPFNSPIARHPSTEYADIFPRELLRQRAREIGIPDNGCPEIRWVLGDDGLRSIDKQYSAVVSSHMIEHTPDLVRHLNDVESILLPGGRYFLVIPDHRYCFDHWLAETTIADVIGAHLEQRSRHTVTSKIEHRRLTTHNDPVRHWSGDHGPDTRKMNVDLEGVLSGTFQDSDPDVHSWKFYPDSFTSIIGNLRAAELINFEVERSYPTVRNSLEFFVILRSS